MANSNPLAEVPVGDAMNPDVVAVSPDDGLGTAIRTFEKAGVSGGPVVGDAGELVGMVTLKDLFSILEHPSNVTHTTGPFLRREHQVEELASRAGLKVRDIMTSRVVAVTEDMTLIDAARSMSSAAVSRVPVTDVAGKVVGVLSRDDVISALARAGSAEVIDLNAATPRRRN
jgi:CBS domain-containing protein